MKQINLKQLLDLQDQGGSFKFVATKELEDGTMASVELDNVHHALAFERNEFDIALVEDEPKNKGGRPRKEE